jgi:hypothetical protein
MLLIEFGLKRSSALEIMLEFDFCALECYAFYLETPYHTYGRPMERPMEGRCSLLHLCQKVKGQVHWTLM